MLIQAILTELTEHIQVKQLDPKCPFHQYVYCLLFYNVILAWLHSTYNILCHIIYTTVYIYIYLLGTLYFIIKAVYHVRIPHLKFVALSNNKLCFADSRNMSACTFNCDGALLFSQTQFCRSCQNMKFCFQIYIWMRQTPVTQTQ